MELPSLDGFFESNRDRKMLEMDAVQESVVYRSDAWFGKGEQWEREKFLVLLDGEDEDRGGNTFRSFEVSRKFEISRPKKAWNLI